MMDFLEIDKLSAFYGKAKALHEVSLTVKQGEIIAIIGANGAGKSTLIKVITGVHKPSSGQVYFKGNEVVLQSVAQSRKMGIEAVYQERALCDQQELWRNIFAGREITNVFGFIDIKKQRKEAEKILRDYIGFTSKAITVDSTIMGLSGGEKQGVAFGRSLYFDSDLIVLDEPFVGLDQVTADQLNNFLEKKLSNGVGLILTSHINPMIDCKVLDLGTKNA